MSRFFPEETWKRNQYVMVAVVFVVFTGFAFVLPFLPLYVQKLDVPDPEQAALWGGILIGIAPLLAGILAPLWGRWADKHGQKRMAVRALSSYVVLLILSGMVTSVWQLLLLRVGIGLFGGVGPLGLAMATSLAPRDQTGRAVGMIQAAQILAAAGGPFAGGYLADTIGIPLTFVATAGLCGIALFLVLRYYVEGPAAPRAEGARPGESFGEILRLPHVLSLLVVLFLVNFVGRSFTPILPLHLRGLGVPVDRLAFSTGALISAYSLAAAISATGLGRAAQRHPPRALLILSLVGGAFTVLPMAMAPSFGAILSLALLLGLASGGSLTLCYTIGGLMVPADHRTAAFGFFSGAALFGGAIAPSVAGLLAHWELRGIYYLDTAIFLVLAASLLPGTYVPAVSGAPRPEGEAPS